MSNQRVKAAFIGQKGAVELRSVELPKLEEGSLLVKMKSSGICGTDLEKLSGGYTASNILGHEVAGIVSESRSSEFEPGNSVVPHHHVACGNCYYCRNRAETMCEGFHTSNFVPGGFAEEFKVPEYNVTRGGVHKFKGISFDEASFAEPLGCCIRGIEKAVHSRLDQILDSQVSGYDAPKIKSALVVGAGPIGLLHMELLRSQFENLKLVAVDIIHSRLEFAEKFEKAEAIVPSGATGDFSEESKKHVDGRGFDLVIVATGSASAFSEAVKCLRKSGTLLLFGAAHKGSNYSLDIQSTLLNELSITSSYATTEREIAEAISLLESGKVNVKKFITSQFRLDEINEAMQSARKEGQVKVLISD